MKVTVTPDVFKLAQVFTISRGSRTEAKVLTVKVKKDGVTGWGECVPYARYNETLDSVTAEIEALPADFTREELQSLLPAGAVAQQAPAPARAAELEHMVIQDCGSCHGLTMKGGLGSPLTREALDGADAGALSSIILDGVPGTAMPPWRPLLTEAEALWIANYLLTKEPVQ